MTIQIADAQADHINGAPVDQCFLTLFVLSRDYLLSSPWQATFKFSMAMRTQEGQYIPTRLERTCLIHDMDAEAASAYQAGETDVAAGMLAFEKGIAALIRLHFADLTSAAQVTMPPVS